MLRRFNPLLPDECHSCQVKARVAASRAAEEARNAAIPPCMRPRHPDWRHGTFYRCEQCDPEFTMRDRHIGPRPPLSAKQRRAEAVAQGVIWTVAGIVVLLVVALMIRSWQNDPCHGVTDPYAPGAPKICAVRDQMDQ